MISNAVSRTEFGERKARVRVSISQIGGGAVMLLCAVVTTVLLARDEGLALAAVGALAFCAFLMTAPPYWLALLLIVLTPFEGLITGLLGGFDSSARQWFAMWKEVLLAVGIFRVLWQNPNRRAIIVSNRSVLVWTGLLMVVYFVTLIRSPGIPAIFAFDLETRFLAVMLFFMFLDLNEKRTTALLRTMMWSISLIALYGLIQYEWDYERLLPLMYHVADLSADGTRRLYSYALSVFDSGYGSMIAILILFAGAGRTSLRVASLCLALLVPCLLLTFVRSAYIGLLLGVITICVVDRTHVRRHALVVGIALYLICAVFLFSGASALNSSIGRRLDSIVSQTDGSSAAHKQSMQKALQSISANPFGIGLGKSGIVQARFAGGVDEADMTEDWVLQAAVQTGVIGAFAYLGLTGAILVSLLRRRSCLNKAARQLRVVGGAVFLAMSVAGVMIPVWDHLLTAVYAWTMVGMALATCRAHPPTGPYVLDRAAYTVGQQSRMEPLGMRGQCEQ